MSVESKVEFKVLSKLVCISGQRYREVHGLFFDDFLVGDIYEHRPGRTVTETDNVWMSLICMNTHPLHIDSDYASRSEFGKPLVSSLVTFSIVGGMSLASTSAQGVVNLGWENIRLVAPVFAGETVYAESEILSKRLSGSRPGQGIVAVKTKGVKVDGSVFLTCERSFLVPLSVGFI